MRYPMMLSALAAAWLAAGPAAAQDQKTYTLKLANFSPQQGSSGRMFERYAAELKAKSGGRLILQNYHGASMGPMPRHFDLARTGVADLSFFQHGINPGRFPLTELIHLPYMVRDPEIAAKVMMDLLPGPLANEHKDAHILWLVSTLPADVYHSSKPIKTVAELKGQRLRAPTSTIVGMLKDLGAVPIGVPANLMAESLQKGTLDGIITDTNGVFTFKLGNLVKYRTPLFKAVLTFGLAVNKKSYAALPPDLKMLLDSLGGKPGAVRAAKEGWTENPLWSEYLKKEGVVTETLPAGSDAEMRKLAETYAQNTVAALEKKGLPARKVYADMRALAAKYEQEK